jgi:hypothetical protein
MCAAWNSNMLTVKALLEGGADPRQADKVRKSGPTVGRLLIGEEVL